MANPTDGDSIFNSEEDFKTEKIFSDVKSNIKIEIPIVQFKNEKLIAFHFRPQTFLFEFLFVFLMFAF